MKNFTQYIIRDYATGDEEGITTLFNEVFGKEMSRGQWKWKYLIPGEWKIFSKVAEDDASKKIIGHAGAVPLRGIFQNRTIQFFQIADVMVHTGARGFLGRKNVFDSLMKNLFEDIRKEFPDVFCYGFPGTRPYILGYRIRVYERIEQAFEIVKHIRRSLLNPYKIQKISWDDDRLNSLWERFTRDFPLSLIRDKHYLNIRYATNPFFSYQLLGIFLSKKLYGWAVIRDSGDEVLVIDLLTEKKRCRSILKALQNYFIFQGKKTMRLWLPEMWRKNVKGFTRKETPVVVTNMVWKLPLTTAVVKENLYYTMGDADIF